MTWSKHAACASPEIESAWFFPISSVGRKSEKVYDKARAVCAGCPVVDECLQHATENGLTFGMYGGKSPAARVTTRPVPPCGTYAAGRRHGRMGEPVCELCRVALAEYRAKYYRRQSERSA